MTGPITIDDYTEFLAKEYLLDYIRVGGAAVKFCVGEPATLTRFATRLVAVADDNNYQHAAIDAATTKVSMTDQVLFALTRSLDFQGLANSIIVAAYQMAGFGVDDGADLDVHGMAAHHQVDAGELHRSVRRRLEQTLLADRQLPRDLRLALFRLAQHQLDCGDVSDTEATTIEHWLTGKPAPGAALRSSGIRYRITRSSAQRMLTALPLAVVAGGRRGLIVNLCLDRLGRDRPKGTTDALYYSKVARLDVYEILRQLVDATDSIRHCLLVVTLPSELYHDQARGPATYHALATRLDDDVADGQLSNPFAAVVHVA